MIGASVPPVQTDALTVRDLRTCDAGAEIDRCRRILAWLDSTPAAELVRPIAPQRGPDLVSVVLPMYNAEPWIELCLKGLLAQTHTNFEVFCVDDASSDGTFDRIIESFGGDDRICAIKLAKTVGPYQIKNWVIGTLAHGEWIALQDADDVSHPQRLAGQLAWMKTHRYRVSGTCTHQFFPPGMPLRTMTSLPPGVSCSPRIVRSRVPREPPRHRRVHSQYHAECQSAVGVQQPRH